MNLHNRNIKEEIYNYCNEFLLKRPNFPDNQKKTKPTRNVNLEEEFQKLVISDEEKKTRKHKKKIIRSIL